MMRPEPGDDAEFRPRQFREIVDSVVHIYRRNAVRLIAIAVVVQLVVFLIGSLAGEPVELDEAATDEGTTVSEATVDEETDQFGDDVAGTDAIEPTAQPVLGDTEGPATVVTEEGSEPTSDIFGDLDGARVNWGSTIVFALMLWVAIVVSQAAMAWVVLESTLNLRSPLSLTMRRALARLGPVATTLAVFYLLMIALIGVTLFLSVMIGDLAIILGTLVGLYVAVRLVMAPLIALVQRAKPVDALRESYRLTANDSMRIFGFLLAFVAFLFVAGTVLTFTVGFIPFLGDIAVASLMFPPWFILMTVLYLDLRVRDSGPSRFTRDALSHELGLTLPEPPPGPQAPPFQPEQ